jgi:hypothetical protein
MPYNLDYASRLVPRANFDINEKLNSTIAAFCTMADAGSSFNGYMYALPHGSNGSISMTIAVMSIEQGSIVTSPMEKSAD